MERQHSWKDQINNQSTELEQSLTPHPTKSRSSQRWSSQPITWLILTNKTVQENTQTKYNSNKIQLTQNTTHTKYNSHKIQLTQNTTHTKYNSNAKYSKTELSRFSHLLRLRHSSKKRDELILQCSRAHTGNNRSDVCSHFYCPPLVYAHLRCPCNTF